MDKCINCSSTRIALVCAQCKDHFNWQSDENEYDGYVFTPSGEFGSHLGDDYIEFKYCLECGQIQYEFPVLGK